jgi:hypothetical protein
VALLLRVFLPLPIARGEGEGEGFEALHATFAATNPHLPPSPLKKERRPVCARLFRCLSIPTCN